MSVDGGIAEMPEGAAVELEIENFNGTVSVKVDSRLDRPVVTAAAEVCGDLHGSAHELAIESVIASYGSVERDGRQVIRIQGQTTWADPSAVRCELLVRLPRCDGVRISNHGGSVRLDGVRGPITVHNSARADGSAGIVLRTDQRLVDNVSLVTDRGNVTLQTGPNSAGVLLLRSDDGRVRFARNSVAPRSVKVDGEQLTAIINDGANSVELRTAKGDVRACFGEDPMAYSNTLR